MHYKICGMCDKKIFIRSLMLCLFFLLLHSFLESELNIINELDLISHFFGGLCVTVILCFLVFKYTKYNIAFVLLLLCFLVIIFEIFECILFWNLELYTFYDFEYLCSISYLSDTFTDVLFGIGAGFLYLIGR